MRRVNKKQGRILPCFFSVHILLQPIWAGRKIAQIGQTEPAGDTRRRTWVRREVKFVQNTRHKIEVICHLTNYFFKVYIIYTFLILRRFIINFLCLVCCVHFATAHFTGYKLTFHWYHKLYTPRSFYSVQALLHCYNQKKRRAEKMNRLLIFLLCTL